MKTSNVLGTHCQSRSMFNTTAINMSMLNSLRITLSFLTMEQLNAFDTMLYKKTITYDDVCYKLWFVLCEFIPEITRIVGRIVEFRSYFRRFYMNEIERVVLDLCKETNGMTETEYRTYLEKARVKYNRY